MAYLNANIPPIYCQVRKEYLYDLKEHHGESEDCVVFGVASITGKALLFHIMLPNGAVFYRLPISAFFKKHISRSEVPDMSVDSLQLWNCFSYYNTEHSEIPQEHKCAHIIELENGNYAAQPNNRIIWHVNSYTTKNNWPDYKVQNTVWNVEGGDWVTEDSDKMFYDLEKKDG
jgi:hypothetical protein